MRGGSPDVMYARAANPRGSRRARTEAAVAQAAARRSDRVGRRWEEKEWEWGGERDDGRTREEKPLLRRLGFDPGVIVLFDFRCGMLLWQSCDVGVENRFKERLDVCELVEWNEEMLLRGTKNNRN